MNASAPALPPLASIQAALRKTTEGLAAELGRPGLRAPDWSEFEWRAARAIAALHGVSPILASHLRWQGPQGWQHFLNGQRRHTVLRAARLQQSLALIAANAQDHSVGFIALKGMALCELGIYGEGERPMSDLDLLVHEADAPAMSRALVCSGLTPTHASWKEQVFEPQGAPKSAHFGEHADNPIKVDLHTRIGERLPRRLVDISALISPARLQQGRNPYPDLVALMTHLLLHAAGEMVFRTLRLIQLHDIGMLAARFSAVEWEQLLRQRTASWGLWWALPPLSLVARYYPTVPPEVLAALRDCSPAALRRLAPTCVITEVSYSNMRRSALPGLNWSRSAGERLGYAVERTFVSARTLLRASLSHAATTSQEVGGPQPASVRWHQLRPVRPATLKALQAALSGPA